MTLPAVRPNELMDDATTTAESVSAEAVSFVNPVRKVVFAILSAGFLVWVVFGSVEARVWVSGKLTLLDRPIATMWQYLGNNLPDLPAAGLISMLYWLSISFIVVGTIAGLWLFLCTPDDQPHDETWEQIHSAHLNHEAK